MTNHDSKEQELPLLCIPSNLQDDLVDRVDFSRVSEAYGKLKEDPLGGGRSSVVLPSVSGRRGATKSVT